MGKLDWVKDRGQEKAVDFGKALSPEHLEQVKQAGKTLQQATSSAPATEQKVATPPQEGDKPKVGVEKGKEVEQGAALSPKTTPSVGQDRGRGWER